MVDLGLSEDPDFAEMCRENGLVFVGPDPEVMVELGDKATARRLMAKTGLPMAPGGHYRFSKQHTTYVQRIHNGTMLSTQQRQQGDETPSHNFQHPDGGSPAAS